ncbi:MAG: carbohydrate ABC transporter permease [Schleiferilactobacillus harbinensis]|jgi:multiple sugar transport system permease protein|nr:carbohydrate ABC transporter permease [Schleiferilactobacillus harbinensis]MCI1911434.1 carbohydrate ABC transporter permease [Schleiferilactobacillus harbinensis]
MKTRGKKISRTVAYVLLTIYSAITLYPFIWAFFASFKPYSEIVKVGAPLIPHTFSMANYQYIFTQDPLFPKWIINSLVISIVGTLINIVFNSMSGYALARLHFPGRNALFMIILVCIMVPAQILLIPNYLIMKALGILDSYSALILPSAVNFAYIFMMRQFFISFPKELEESAQLDGLGRLGIFYKIVVPMAKSSIATQAIFVFLAFWNDFMRPLLYITTESKYTLTLGLQSFQTQHGTQWNYIMAAAMITILPIIVLYILLNRYFMVGMRIGGEK